MFEITNLTNGDWAEAETAEDAYVAYMQLKRDSGRFAKVRIVNLETDEIVVQDR